MQDNNELQNRREKLIKSIGESLGLADLSEESLAAERIKIQKELDFYTKVGQESGFEIRQYIELDKLMPSPDEIKSAVKEFNIKSDELTLKLHEKSKNGTPLEKHTALADYQLEMFKLDFLHAFTKHSLIIIQDLEYILETIIFILGLANEVSIKKKLSAIKEIRRIVLRSNTKAKQLLEMEELGLHESNSKSIVIAMKQQISKEVYSDPDALMLTPLITDPIFVAKTHIPMYGRILEFLDREEEMILIELRNGKSLDYSPLNDKKDNPQPTTSATVEENKKELTFDNLFPSVEDKEMVMKMLVGLKIINSEGKYLLGNRTGMIRVFIDVMKEEGYFVNIDRKPILRVFTPVILGKAIEVIKEPLDFNSKKNQIIRKLLELKK